MLKPYSFYVCSGYLRFIVHIFIIHIFFTINLVNLSTAYRASHFGKMDNNKLGIINEKSTRASVNTYICDCLFQLYKTLVL